VASTAFFLAPLLVLAGAWFLLTAADDSNLDRRRQAVVGAGCLAAAVALTAVGIALDHRAAAPSPRQGSTAARG
jgi:hypothetical protein